MRLSAATLRFGAVRVQLERIEYQFRNWYHFTWLSGDDVPQSLIHNLDSALWVIQEETPMRIYGLGGRASEFKTEMGTSLDHHSIICEYANGRRIYGSVRTAVGCFNNNTDVFHGTKGRCIFNAFDPPRFTDLKGNVTWKADAKLSSAVAVRSGASGVPAVDSRGPSVPARQATGDLHAPLRARPGRRVYRQGSQMGRGAQFEIRLPARGRSANGHGAARATGLRRPLPDRQTRRNEPDLRTCGLSRRTNGTRMHFAVIRCPNNQRL